MAARLSAHTPVLVTCSNADIQVSCSEVDRVVAALAASHAATDFLRLNGVDHVLKVDSSRTATEYTAPLPFSPQLKDALRAFVARDL
jgi:uncharacterized protein